jgi:hypothetical protein
MGGGALRGPVAFSRQRRTIRIVQIILVLVAAALLLFAGFSLGQKSGYDRGSRSEELGSPTEPSSAQTLVLTILGLAFLGGAFAIQSEGGVRLLTPARLRDMERLEEGPVAYEPETATPEAQAGPTPSGPESSELRLSDEGGAAGPPRH